jgi:glycosyltransferase involved in cell wall biosynthesis
MNNIGGTELETIIIARTFLDSKKTESIEIFCTTSINEELLELTKGYNITFSNYPPCINTSLLKYLDRFFNKIIPKKIHHISITKATYWWFKNLLNNYECIMPIGSNNQFHYLDQVSFVNKKKVKLKYTGLYTNHVYNPSQINLLGKFFSILVTSSSQKSQIEKKTQLENIITTDVLILNEERLLSISVEKKQKIKFGLLTRISREKKIEDAITLISELIKAGYDVELIIQGPAIDNDYSREIELLINTLNVSEHVHFIRKALSPSETPSFFETLSFFLITSITEGGPNTGLESMAAGIPSITYNVGAMKDRLKNYASSLICENIEDMVIKSKKLINLEAEEYMKLSHGVRDLYCSHLSNKYKLSLMLSKPITND